MTSPAHSLIASEDEGVREAIVALIMHYLDDPRDWAEKLTSAVITGPLARLHSDLTAAREERDRVQRDCALASESFCISMQAVTDKWQATESEALTLRERVAKLEEKVIDMREAAKVACLDLADVYREAGEDHIQNRAEVKARQALDWADGAMMCAHAIAKLPPSSSDPKKQP